VYVWLVRKLSVAASLINSASGAFFAAILCGQKS
jgi:hypothetical protein